MSDAPKTTTRTAIPWHAWKRRRVEAVSKALEERPVGRLYYEIILHRVGVLPPLMRWTCNIDGSIHWQCPPGSSPIDTGLGRQAVSFIFNAYALPLR